MTKKEITDKKNIYKMSSQGLLGTSWNVYMVKTAPLSTL